MKRPTSSRVLLVEARPNEYRNFSQCFDKGGEVLYSVATMKDGRVIKEEAGVGVLMDVDDHKKLHRRIASAGREYSHGILGAKPSNKRRVLDDYETPPHVTEALLKHVSFPGPILEPCAGTGRIAKVLRAAGYKVQATDIKRGQDFLARRAMPSRKKWSIVTNPPYKNGLPFEMLQRSLHLAASTGGKVAFLVKHGFEWSATRRDFMNQNRWSTRVVMSDRILFLLPNGKPIKGQFFDHLWMVWDYTGSWDGVQKTFYE